MARRAVVAVFALVVFAALLSGCGSGVSSPEQSQQQSVVSAEASLRANGFTKVTLHIRHADGTVEEHCVWLADTDAERAQGMVGISDPSIGGAEAMAFLFEGVTSRAFWMKGTKMPLSIAWVDADGAVLGTTDMNPCPVGLNACEQFAPPSPYKTAIEMAQGRLQDWGIEPGALVRIGDSC